MGLFANAEEGLAQGFPPDMTIKELLGKAPVAKTSKEIKSKATSSTGNNEALRNEALRKAEIGRILAAITNSAQHLSGQIHALANKKAA